MSAAPKTVADNDRRGFQPPPYPYARLGAFRAKADGLPGGAVDLSVG